MLIAQPLVNAGTERTHVQLTRLVLDSSMPAFVLVPASWKVTSLADPRVMLLMLTGAVGRISSICIQ